LADRPDEAGEFASHSAERALPSNPPAEMAVLVMEPLLTTPADLADLRGNAVLALSQRIADRRLEPRMMGGLAENVTEQSVTGLGEMSTTT